MSVLSLRPGARKAASARDASRDRLAFAIGAAAEAERAATATRVAVERATEMAELAEVALARATADVEAAKAAATARMIEAAGSGEPMAPDASLRNARAAEAAARDERDAAREALLAVKAAVEGPERQAAWTKARLEEAAKLVILSKAEGLFARACELRAELVRQVHVMSGITRLTLNAGVEFDEITRQMNNFAAVAWSLPGMNSQTDQTAAAAPWSAALQALMADPDAPLPET